MRPFFSYYGGKWRAAFAYPRPRHGLIIEPFAGSAGYSLRWCVPFVPYRVILCDVDPVIAGVWRYLMSVSAEEILKLPDVVDSVDDLAVCEEARHLIGFWLNRGAAAPCKSPSAWMRAGTHESSFWGPAIRRRIANQLDGLRLWEVYCCSYEDVPYDGEATWFVDPPYQGAGKHYRRGSSDIDYADLADWCRKREGLVIACEAEGGNWLPFDDLGVFKATRAGKPSREVVWVND